MTELTTLLQPAIDGRAAYAEWFRDPGVWISVALALLGMRVFGRNFIKDIKNVVHK